MTTQPTETPSRRLVAGGRLQPVASLRSAEARQKTYDVFEAEAWSSRMAIRVPRLELDNMAGYPTPISGDLSPSLGARLGSGEPPC